MSKTNGNHLMTFEQAAKYLSVNLHTFKHSYRKWGVKPTKIGQRLVRFSQADLDKFVKASMHNGTGR